MSFFSNPLGSKSKPLTQKRFEHFQAKVHETAKDKPNGEACLGRGAKLHSLDGKDGASLKKGEGKAIEQLKAYLNQHAASYGAHNVQQVIHNLDDLGKYGCYSNIQLSRALEPLTPEGRRQAMDQALEPVTRVLANLQQRKPVPNGSGSAQTAQAERQRALDQMPVWSAAFHACGGSSNTKKAKALSDGAAPLTLAQQLDQALLGSPVTSDLDSHNLVDGLDQVPLAAVERRLGKLAELQGQLSTGPCDPADLDKIQHQCKALMTLVETSIERLVRVPRALRDLVAAGALTLVDAQVVMSFANSLVDLAKAHTHPHSQLMQAYRLAWDMQQRARQQASAQSQPASAAAEAEGLPAEAETVPAAPSTTEDLFAAVDKMLDGVPDAPRIESRKTSRSRSPDSAQPKAVVQDGADANDPLLQQLIATANLPSPRGPQQADRLEQQPVETLSDQDWLDFMLQASTGLTAAPKNTAPIEPTPLDVVPAHRIFERRPRPVSPVQAPGQLRAPWADARPRSDRAPLLRPIRTTRDDLRTPEERRAFDHMFAQMDNSNVALSSRPGQPLESLPTELAVSMAIDDSLGLQPNEALPSFEAAQRELANAGADLSALSADRQTEPR